MSFPTTKYIIIIIKNSNANAKTKTFNFNVQLHFFSIYFKIKRMTNKYNLRDGKIYAIVMQSFFF